MLHTVCTIFTPKKNGLTVRHHQRHDASRGELLPCYAVSGNTKVTLEQKHTMF
jgi:hypothetical protein